MLCYVSPSKHTETLLKSDFRTGRRVRVGVRLVICVVVLEKGFGVGHEFRIEQRKTK